ncbi:Arc family DNA-binding protein [Ruania alkalisoli]|uniref:Arc family DNA-binding protein n=2 Tax=Ruania TaxID=626119 RepID=A0A7M1SP44_9MICO|nr:Arc family DNA-binding protein [Ruania alkalisoli]QOR69339.1 Arc family DNA-binding protein [Ruania alkalisoli]
MATVTVRNLPEHTRRALKARAAQHDRSMEAEIRAILEDAVAERTFIVDWIHTAHELEGVDLTLPERQQPRSVELT